MPDNTQLLHESLLFHRPPVWDPATLLLKDRLDPVALHELAMAQLEHQKALTQAHLSMIEKTQTILSKAKK